MAENLPELLDAELRRGLTEVIVPAEETRPEDLLTPGLSRRENVTALAELLSGTDNRSSRAYLSARRQAERWLPSEAMLARGIKARQPVLPSRLRLASVRRLLDQRIKDMRVHGADMRLRVSWYGERRQEWLPPHRWIHIRAFATRTVIKLWSDDQIDRAAELLMQEFVSYPGAGYGYEVPNPADWLRDVVVVELLLEPAGRT
jgi:hypothetical protein